MLKCCDIRTPYLLWSWCYDIIGPIDKDTVRIEVETDEDITKDEATQDVIRAWKMVG